jgi:hypothetical protein
MLLPSRQFRQETDHQVLIALFEKHNNPLGFDDSQESNGRKRKAAELDEAEVGGWAYMGSHNFTPSAWVSAIQSSSGKRLKSRRET